MLSDTAGRCGYKKAQDRANISYVRLNTKAAGNMGSVLGWGRSPGGGNGNLLQYSRPDDSMDREVWRGTVHGVAKSQTRRVN